MARIIILSFLILGAAATKFASEAFPPLPSKLGSHQGSGLPPPSDIQVGADQPSSWANVVAQRIQLQQEDGVKSQRLAPGDASSRIWRKSLKGYSQSAMDATSINPSDSAIGGSSLPSSAADSSRSDTGTGIREIWPTASKPMVTNQGDPSVEEKPMAGLGILHPDLSHSIRTKRIEKTMAHVRSLIPQNEKKEFILTASQQQLLEPLLNEMTPLLDAQNWSELHAVANSWMEHLSEVYTNWHHSKQHVANLFAHTNPAHIFDPYHIAGTRPPYGFDENSLFQMSIDESTVETIIADYHNYFATFQDNLTVILRLFTKLAANYYHHDKEEYVWREYDTKICTLLDWAISYSSVTKHHDEVMSLIDQLKDILQAAKVQP